MGATSSPIPFLVDRWKLLGCAILLTVWKGLGYYMIVYLAALGNVDHDLHEAAALDGAGTFQRFRNVTIPGIRPAMVLIIALIAVSGMRIFSELYVLTNGTGGPGGEDSSLVMIIKQVGTGLSGQLGYASALSVVLFFLTLIPLTVIGWANNKDPPIRTSDQTRRRSRSPRRRYPERHQGDDGHEHCTGNPVQPSRSRGAADTPSTQLVPPSPGSSGVTSS